MFNIKSEFPPLKSLSIALLFGLLSFFVSFTASAQSSALQELMGEKAYNHLQDEGDFNEIEWNYFELVALKIATVKNLIQSSSYVVDWDEAYVGQNELLNALSFMKPMAEEAADLMAVIADDEDNEIVLMAKEELVELENSLQDESEKLVQILWNLVQPKVSGDIMIEILPPQNYPESPLSIGALTQFYLNLAGNIGWRAEVLSAKENDKNAGSLVEGGRPLSHAYIKIRGRDAYRRLFLESGTHRFIFRDEHKIGASTRNDQPHTTYADVKVYATPKSSRFLFNESDVDFQFTRSSGAGGQHVNTTDSAVRATHRPSGLTVFVQQERNQHQNRRVALDMLRAKLFTQHIETQREIREQARSSNPVQVGSSRYVRTLNFNRNPVQSRTILRGDYPPENFNGWETYLREQLPYLSEQVSEEISAISAHLPERLVGHANLAIAESIRNDQVPSALRCNMVLAP